MIDSLLKRLVASPFLRRSRIERDERGRVSRVSATLGPDERAPPDRTGEPALPELPEPDGRERAERVDAAGWLDAAALRDAREFALGEERSYTFDQATGALSLRHADGAVLTLPGEILGSFRPQDRSFRWGWANPNVAPDMARAALLARESMTAAAARTPTFRASYAEAKALAALAARLGGCRGVYRAVSDRHLSIFIGYGEPEGALRPNRTASGGTTTDADLAEAKALVDRYDAAMLPHDVRAHERGSSVDAADGSAQMRVLDEALTGKRAVHERFWHRADDYWDPVSVEWPSPHDPVRQRRRLALPRRAGGAYVISQVGHATDALVAERVGNEWRITDRDLDWGQGLPLLSRDELPPPDAPSRPGRGMG